MPIKNSVEAYVFSIFVDLVYKEFNLERKTANKKYDLTISKPFLLKKNHIYGCISQIFGLFHKE